MNFPVIDLNVVSLSYKSVYVFGEISNPGIHPIDSNIRLADFLASSCHLLNTADIDVQWPTQSWGGVCTNPTFVTNTNLTISGGGFLTEPTLFLPVLFFLYTHQYLEMF